jgi:PmbA protein
MITESKALDVLSALIGRAQHFGADAADAVLVVDESVSASVRLGDVEDVGRSEGQDLGLRVFVGGQNASVSTSDFSSDALERTAERAVAMARHAPPDPYAGLADPALLVRGDLPDVDVYDTNDPSVETLLAVAREAEDAARAVKGITNSEGGGAGAHHSLVALATSTGFARAYRSSSFSVSATVVAGDSTAMERDYDYHSARHWADLMSPADIGRSAGERTVKRLNPIRLGTETLPIVFDPRIGSSLVGHFLSAISGAAITRGTSFLIGKLGTRIFGANISIHDEPHRRRGLRSRAFDGEGLPTHPRALIENGTLTTWLLDCASARQLNMVPTGHASRGASGPPGPSASNVHMAAGKTSRADMINAIKRGLYVTEMIGMGVNTVTGDYSRGAAGFLIENGELTVPVSEITIAGTLQEMFMHTTAASDLSFRYATNVPTLMVEGMTIAGN